MTSRPPANPKSAGKLALRDARILIVDDEVGNLCLCVNILNRLGYKNLLSIGDPLDVFNRAAQFQPDLMLLDLRMAKLGGFEILGRFRQEKENDLPIIVMTGDTTTETKRRALTAGATDFLAKPFDSVELNVRISNAVQARFLRREVVRQNSLLGQRVAERTRELEKALSDLKAAQNQMLQQERLRAFSEMAGGVAHDFNNTLMSVIGYSDIMLQDPSMLADTATVTEYLRIMNTAGRDAADVVARLRDFHRPREESDVFVPLDLNRIVEEIVPLTQPKWRDQALATGRSIEVRLDLEKLPPVFGNAQELREVATNLIFNAVDAIPADGTITLRTVRDGADVILEVRDTGSGMSEETRVRCLEPFYSTKGEMGTGLGLSMVFGIVKRHEGRIDIESEIDSGTCISIRLPSTNRVLDNEVAEARKPVRSLHILVVDDDPRSRDVLAKYLAADGHSVESAENGIEALHRFEEERFDLVTTDHAMPGINGLQLTERLRASRPDLPVILVSGFTASGLSPHARLDHLDAKLRKPVRVEDLRAAVLEIVENGSVISDAGKCARGLALE